MMDNPRPAQSYAPNMQRHDCIGAMMPNPESGDWVSFYAANKQINEANGLLRAVMEHITPAMAFYEKGMPEHPVIASIREYMKGGPAMSTPSPVAPVAPARRGYLSKLKDDARVKEAWNEGEDGYWVTARPGWSFDFYGDNSHTIHEWTVKDLRRQFSTIRKCECRDCTRAALAPQSNESAGQVSEPSTSTL